MRNSQGYFLIYAIALLLLMISCTGSKTSTPQIDEGFKVTIPQKALHKNKVSVSLEAAPGTACELTYISPSGDISYMEAAADTSGICSWTWKVDETKGRGAGRLIFTIEGVSETHFIEIRASF
jgi:hypothetical protein